MSAESAQASDLSHAAPPPVSAKRSMPRFIFFGADGLRAGWSLLLFSLLIYIFYSRIMAIIHRLAPSYGLPKETMTPFGSIVREAMLFLVVAVITFVLARIERRPLRAFGIGATPGAARQFFTGLGWGVLILSALVGTLSLTHQLVFTGVLLSGPSILRFAAEWAIAFLLVGLFEESFLRGYLQFTLARGLAGVLRAMTDSPYTKAIGFWIAAALLSFYFGLGHRTNPGESPIGLVSAGLIGLVFCLSLWRTGSLWWAIGFHAAWDWMQSFVFGVADSGMLAQFHLLASHPQGRPLLSGGTTGPEGSLLILPTTALIAAIVLLTLKPTGWPTPGSALSPATLPPQP